MDMWCFQQTRHERRIVITDQYSFPFMSSERCGMIHHPRAAAHIAQYDDHGGMFSLGFIADAPDYVEGGQEGREEDSRDGRCEHSPGQDRWV